jgi:hypothetical protein
VTDTRTPPFDLEAEQAVLYAALFAQDAVEELRDVGLEPAHFYAPDHQVVLAAVYELAHEGAKVDAVLVRERARRNDGPDVHDALVAVVAAAGSVSNVSRYARIVKNHAAARRLIAAAADVLERTYARGNPGDVAARGIDAFGAIDAPSDAPPRGLFRGSVLAAVDLAKAQPWVVPGMFREQWRVLAVGPEGFGKSTMALQLAMCTAAGVHPLSFKPIEPVPTLVLMLENRIDTYAHQYRLVDRPLHRMAPGEHPFYVWHRQEGVDLRSARHRAELVEVLGAVKPKLVCLCPLYKAFKVERGENYEQATSGLINVLDDLQTRYGFALLAEHHAGKRYGGARDLDPSGSAVWLRWPEIGLSMKPDGDPGSFTELEFTRHRGDRVPNEWPVKVVKGREWPWEGVWNAGHFAKPQG